MAAESRRADPVVADVLFAEGYRFEFFQAVRVLERTYAERQAVGRDANPDQEVVRFRAHLSLSFPPSEIHEITPAKDEQNPARMTVAFMGLTGPLGTLPRHYTDLLLERDRMRLERGGMRRKDSTLRDFLDLFNHRMISLFYRAWEKYRFPIAYERAVRQGQEHDPFSLGLFDFIGMGTKGLRGRLLPDIEDDALFFYAGLLGQRPHSASALESILQDYFEIPVSLVQFMGQWLRLTKDSRSRLGWDGANCQLGVDALAGDRVWDQQAKFRVRLGPLSYRQFCRFLPSGDAFRTSVRFIRFIAGQEQDFDVQLILKADEVPRCPLGVVGAQAPRLGWSTWLKGEEKPFPHDADDAIFGGGFTLREAIPNA